MKQSTKILILDLCLTTLTAVVLLFLLSWLIEIGILPLDGYVLLVLAAVIISSMLGTYRTTARSGVVRDGAIFLAALFLILLLASFFVHGLDILNTLLLKLTIAMMVGAFLGAIFGQKKYYKMRNLRKRASGKRNNPLLR